MVPTTFYDGTLPLRKPAEDSGRCLLRRLLAKWQGEQEFRAFSNLAGHFNPPMMLLDNPSSERKPQSSAVPLGRVEGPEDVGKMFRGDAAPRVSYADGSI